MTALRRTTHGLVESCLLVICHAPVGNPVSFLGDLMSYVVMLERTLSGERSSIAE